MVKVDLPLHSGDARGQFGKKIIFTKGGYARRYFRPRNPNTDAQKAVREAFKDFFMAGLTQEQADLLYAAIAHLHDDRYPLLNHVHDHGTLNGLGDDDHEQYFNQSRGDARYALLGHNHSGVYSTIGHGHVSRVPILFHAFGGSLPSGATYYMAPGVEGLLTTVNGTLMPLAGTLKNLYFRLNSTQPASGSLVVTAQKNVVDQALTITIPASSPAGIYSDVSNSVSFSGGEILGIKIKNNATGTSAAITSVALEFQPATI